MFHPNVAQLPDDKNNEGVKSVRSPSWLVAVYKMAPGRPEYHSGDFRWLCSAYHSYTGCIR